MWQSGHSRVKKYNRFPHSGQTICTLDACSGASRFMMPPLMFLLGFGRVWRLTKFTPSTRRRFVAGIVFRTRPRLPRSFPAVTRTVSFRRMGVCNRDMTLNHLGRE